MSDAARYLRSCFWLVVPILVFNLAFADRLPPSFQPPAFDRDLPPGLGVVENVLRALVLGLPVLMPIGRGRRVGFLIYGVGLAAYVGSWGLLMGWPDCAWSTSALGFTAPAWTPAVWLLGIALVSEDRLFVPVRGYRRWMFGVACLAFLATHVFHAGVVFLATSP